MSSNLVTENPITRNTSVEPFFAFRQSLLRQPNDFLKAGLVAASTTCFKNTAELIRFKTAEAAQNADPETKALEKEFDPYAAEYGRYGNPTINRAEELVGLLCEREGAVIFPTKENALISLLSAELYKKPGPHHIILGPNPSASVLDFCNNQLRHVSYTQITPDGYSDVRSIIQPNTRLILLEDEDNTIAQLAKLDAIVKICREEKVLTVIEGKAATPRGISSLEVAADVLIPQSDAFTNKPEVAVGILVSNTKVVGALKAERGLLGGIPAPEVGASIIKGVETFTTRIDQETGVQFLDEKNMGEILHRHTINRRCERELAKLDHADDAVTFPSGMSATTTVFLALLFQDDKPKHIIVSAQGYRKNREFLVYLENAGVEITRLEPEQFGRIEDHLKPHTKIVFIESPTNPFYRITDVQAVTTRCKQHGGIISVVDHTFATPINQRPIDLGADLVAVSATKGLAGHNDTIAGVIAGRADLIRIIRDQQRILGAYPASVTAERVLEGLKTLPRRIAVQNKLGLAVAEALEKDPLVKKVWYPGLPSHPEHAIAKRTLNGFGGVISFDLDLTLEETGRFVDALKLSKIAPSFGGNEPLVSQVAIISHFSQSVEEREKIGITPGLVRFSTGTIFSAKELIEDIRQALDVVRPKLSEGVISPFPVERSPVFPNGEHAVVVEGGAHQVA